MFILRKPRTLNSLFGIFDTVRRNIHKSLIMANSRFDYVRTFETEDILLPNCWMVVRIDGKGFHKFSKAHEYEKPNDEHGKYFKNIYLMQYVRLFTKIRQVLI